MQLRNCITLTMIPTNSMYSCGVHAGYNPWFECFLNWHLGWFLCCVIQWPWWLHSWGLAKAHMDFFVCNQGLGHDVWDICDKILSPIYHVAILYLWYKSVIILHILQCKCKAILRCTSSWKRLVALKVDTLDCQDNDTTSWSCIGDAYKQLGRKF